MKKKSSGKKNKNADMTQPVLSKSVRMEKISNGFVVSTYTDKGEKQVFAKTKKEAKEVAAKML